MKNIILLLFIGTLLCSCMSEKEIAFIKRDCLEKSISYTKKISNPVTKEKSATDYYCGCIEGQGLKYQKIK